MAALRMANKLWAEIVDGAPASLLYNYIYPAEWRAWFLFEAARKGDGSGH
jgi:hypothetical protein